MSNTIDDKVPKKEHSIMDTEVPPLAMIGFAALCGLMAYGVAEYAKAKDEFGTYNPIKMVKTAYSHEKPEINSPSLYD